MVRCGTFMSQARNHCHCLIEVNDFQMNGIPEKLELSDELKLE
jgi:hypothetical protein